MGSFADAVAQFADKAKAAPVDVVRKVSIGLLTNVVLRSPVGNPDLWAANKVASHYNAQVADHNADLRNDPANLTKNGRLKPGRKLNDGMDIVAPAGYVGGRLRANWNVALVAPDESTSDQTDKGGSATISRGSAVIGTADGTKDIYITNSLPYVRPIEYEGHSKQAPVGMVRITVAEFQASVADAVRELSE